MSRLNIQFFEYQIFIIFIVLLLGFFLGLSFSIPLVPPQGILTSDLFVDNLNCSFKHDSQLQYSIVVRM